MQLPNLTGDTSLDENKELVFKDLALWGLAFAVVSVIVI